MPSKPTTVDEYLAALPADRRDALQAVRETIVENLDKGYEEGIQYGMIGYFVPHSVYPNGYHCDPSQPVPFAAIASQKNHMSLYLFCVYSSEEEQRRFQEAWKKTGKKLDMGKSCVRFKKLDDVPLDVIGASIRRAPVKKFIAEYEASLTKSGRSAKAGSSSAKKPATKKAATTTAGAKKSSSSKVGAKAKTSAKTAARKAATRPPATSANGAAKKRSKSSNRRRGA